jgi:hypothetical protein
MSEHVKKSDELPKPVKDTLVIRNKEIPITIEFLPQISLSFYLENPRVYSVVRAENEEPSQEDIEAELRQREHVRRLKIEIESNGGLMDAVIVRGTTREVIEGNSRLAAYRTLAETDPIKWAYMKCNVLPDDIDESLIAALLGQYHLAGKAQWFPYEQAGFLHRRYHRHKRDIEALKQEMPLSRATIKLYIDTYQFMLDQKDNTQDRWSYYYEYLKSGKIRKARKRFPDFDDVLIEKIKNNEMTAQDLRDKLPVICDSPKTLRKLLAEKITFEDAFEEAENTGVSTSAFKRLSSFRKWLGTDQARRQIVRAKGQAAADKIKYEVGQIARLVRRLREQLGDS